MSTPGKTTETLNLAEAMEEDASASDSLTSNSLKDTDKKPQTDDVNANLDQKTIAPIVTESLTKRLNDLDISFREKVVTKDSSTDFVVHEDWEVREEELHRQPSPFRDSFTPRSDKPDAEDRICQEGEQDELTIMKPDDDKNWKPEKGKVYSRVLQIQQSKPKKYIVTEFAKPPGSEEVKVPVPVTPVLLMTELIPCFKCGRKVAPGTMDRHLQFCFPK